MKENQETITAPKVVSDEESKSLVEHDEKSLALQQEPQAGSLVSSDEIKNYYTEAIDCIRQDREEADERYIQFADMAINGGDPSNATKEAMVNLLKIKSDGVNQMVKILDLWTRLAMKDKATSSQIYAYQQNNKYEMAASGKPSPHVRKLIKMAEQMESNQNEQLE